MRRRRVLVFSFRPARVRAVAFAVTTLLVMVVMRAAIIQTTAPLSEVISGRLVVVDPGHGGPDPGTVAGPTVEKEIVLAIAERLVVRFDRAYVRSALTRRTDVDLADPELSGRTRKRQDLARRAEVANAAAADLMVSIHGNSYPSPVWSGAQTFYYPKRDEARQLAVHVQNALVGRLGPNVRREKEGDFFLLQQSKVPAVLVEVGFLSNPREAALLQDPAYQERVAAALFAGVVQYLAQKHTGGLPVELTLNNRRIPAAAPEWRERWLAVKNRAADEAILYFLGPTNREDYLVPEVRRIPGLSDLHVAAKVRRVLDELLLGPGEKSVLSPALPRRLSVTDVAVSGRSVEIRLAAGLGDLGLRGRGEELAVFAMVNTVTEVVPEAEVWLRLADGEPAQDGELAHEGPFTARPDLTAPGRE